MDINNLMNKKAKELREVRDTSIKNKKQISTKKLSRYEQLKSDINHAMKNLGYKQTYKTLNITLSRAYVVLIGLMIILSFFVADMSTAKSFVLTLIALAFLLPTLLYFASFYLIKYWASYILYNRVQEIELHLPDLLQLTAANVNAGMMLERALLYAVKPNFGILAVEMEKVAKSTLTGKSIDDALLEFVDRYDSDLLRRIVNMMLEGLRSGSRMGDLLNKVSINVQEMRIMKKEMGASVMTYVIFISVAAIGAAPVLLGLSHELMVIIKSILTDFIGGGGMSSGSLQMNFDAESISVRNFEIFAYSNLFLTSLFSAMIVSTISKGNIKDGLKYVPIFIVVSITIFIISFKVMHLFFGSMF